MENESVQMTMTITMTMEIVMEMEIMMAMTQAEISSCATTAYTTLLCPRYTHDPALPTTLSVFNDAETCRDPPTEPDNTDDTLRFDMHTTFVSSAHDAL